MKACTVVLLITLLVAVSAVPAMNPSVKTSGDSTTTLSAATSPPSTEGDDTPSQDGGSSNKVCIDYVCVCRQIKEQAEKLLDVPTNEYNMIDEGFLKELNDNPVCVHPGEDVEYDVYCFIPGDIDNIQNEQISVSEGPNSSTTRNHIVYDMICSS